MMNNYCFPTSSGRLAGSTWGSQYVVSRISLSTRQFCRAGILVISSSKRKSPVCKTAYRNEKSLELISKLMMNDIKNK